MAMTRPTQGARTDLAPIGAMTARVIYADPPWRFLTRSVKGKGRSAEAWYDCMSLADIKALPVAQKMAAPDSLLLLWTTRHLSRAGVRRDPCLGLRLQDRCLHLGEVDQGRQGFPDGDGLPHAQ
jgi:MT-A70